MDTLQRFQPLRWFLAAWVAAVYLWTLSNHLLHASDSAPLRLITFTLLIALAGVLLWQSFSPAWSTTAYRRYLITQAVLVFAVGLVAADAAVVFSLCLAVTLGTLAVHGPIRRTIPVACAALALIVLSLFCDAVLDPFAPNSVAAGLAKGAANWPDFWALFWTRSDYPAVLLFACGFLLLFWQQARAHEQLAAAHAELRRSSERIEELTRNTERQRLARELHDTLSQGVAGLIMQLEAANAYLTQRQPAAVEDVLRQAMTAARATLAEARGAIDDLRTLTSYEALTERVEEEIARFQLATGIPCEVALQGLPVVPPALFESVFWAIREGLTNVARHARARRVWVSVAEVEAGQRLAVEVRDDGAGFDPAAIAEGSGHYGLTGLRERARLAGGELELASAPGQGCVMLLRVPLTVGAAGAGGG